jgi:hypothetical protein
MSSEALQAQMIVASKWNDEKMLSKTGKVQQNIHQQSLFS